jgi:hypothetical protein
VETIGALEDRYGDQHLTVERLQQPKIRTQGDGRSRKKLAAFCRRMNRRDGTFLRGVWDVVIKDRRSRRDDGMQQWHKEPRPETAATPGKQGDNL